MNKTHSIVFWQNSPSPHQASTIRALSKIGKNNIACIFNQNIRKERIGLGWSEPDYGNIEIHFLNTEENVNGKIDQLIEKYSDAINIFSGIFSYKYSFYALKKLALKKLKLE